MLLTRPSWLPFELHVLEAYLEILSTLKQAYEIQTTLDQDKALLENTNLSFEMRMVIIYRSERKKIIYNQIHLINLVKYVVE